MEYVGEHLWTGRIGNFFLILALVSALGASISWYISQRNKDESWHLLARRLFILHGGATIAMIATLFYMLFNHMYEYHYVWQHSSNDMPMRYIVACFWEGQEGSFMLWTLWNTLLGFILIRRTSEWTAPVMSIFSSIQVFLFSMLVGFYILDYKIGSNPFTTLLRDHPDFSGLPLFSNPNYLEVLDGRGLNPLLQNYWNTIHPPIVFLGFALSSIPFCYALAGLWKRSYNAWMKPGLPWTFAGIMILGTGILMGGAWAYEALSFGGFWAWDPVENASLVPWITLVGGGHLMLIYRNKGTSLIGAFGLIILTFLLVLYSTFLVRSGILGDSSVHAFTDLGMSGQLVICLAYFVILAVYLFISRYRDIPRQKQEEPIWSREFWMFVGALILLISAFQIEFNTSLPVINKIFGTDLAAPPDVIDWYNRWQVPFAIIIALLMAFVQFLQYRGKSLSLLIKNTWLPFSIAAAITVLGGVGLQMTNPFYYALFFASSFTILGNASYYLKYVKGDFKRAGSSIAHIGIGFILLGALISAGTQKNISVNTSRYDIETLSETMTNRENILLIKGDTLPMERYYVSYTGREKDDNHIRYAVDFLEKNGENYKKSFTLNPFIQLNDRMGNVPEPDTRHFLHKDIYTHVTYAVVEEPKEEVQKKDSWIALGDTLFFSSSIGYLDSIYRVDSVPEIENAGSDLNVAASFLLWDMNANKHALTTYFVLRDSSYTFSVPAASENLGVTLDFKEINPYDGTVRIEQIDKAKKKKDFIVMQAIVFPFINLLWLGCILMIIGTFIAILNRVKSRSQKTK